MNIMEHVSKKNVTITDNFFGFYTELVKDTIIPYQWEALNDRIPDAEPSHAVKNFKIAAGLEQGDFNGLVFQDSDIAKWLEAVGHSLMTQPDPELEKTADAMIDLIEKAQCSDGYLDTYYIIKNEERWSNLYECHELYCAGHMIEAAVAYYEATGKKKLLDIVCRFVDLIDSIFGPEEGKIKGYPGHQEIELALVKLYKVTADIKYLKLSAFFIIERGNEPNYFTYEWENKRGKMSYWENKKVSAPSLSYTQAHKPVRQQETAVGHSVRAVYMYTAMADIAYETKDKELFEACRRLWTDVTQRQMYITGGIGSTVHGEAFTFDYDLPNDTVYAETCASIGLIFFANRMQKINLSSEYGDVIEKVLYNLLPGSMTRSGKEFFYVNPLEVWPEASKKDPGKRHVKAVRQKWFGCACCPPNIARLIASLGDYIYSIDQDTIYTHLYISGHVDAVINDQRVLISQKSNYPYQGDVSFNVSVNKPSSFKLALRIPSWCRKHEIYICGQKVDYDIKNGYAILDRVWENDDSIILNMNMPVEVMASNPKVRENAGKACIMRGPLVYCLEEADNGSNLPSITLCLDKEMKIENCQDKGYLRNTEILNPNNKALPQDSEMKTKSCKEHPQNTATINRNNKALPLDTVMDTESCKDLLQDTVIITAEGTRSIEEGWSEALYRPYQNIKTTPVTVKAIPYYMWGNRGEGEMQVWFQAK